MQSRSGPVSILLPGHDEFLPWQANGPYMVKRHLRVGDRLRLTAHISKDHAWHGERSVYGTVVAIQNGKAKIEVMEEGRRSVRYKPLDRIGQVEVRYDYDETNRTVTLHDDDSEALRRE
jgi:hypothetical protein